jgi:hypothetical protein
MEGFIWFGGFQALVGMVKHVCHHPLQWFTGLAGWLFMSLRFPFRGVCVCLEWKTF